jgi:hypothetical protein
LRDRWADFLEHLSIAKEADYALTLLRTAFDYIKTRDASVLLKLPIEERQLIASLMDSHAKT